MRSDRQRSVSGREAPLSDFARLQLPQVPDSAWWAVLIYSGIVVGVLIGAGMMVLALGLIGELLRWVSMTLVPGLVAWWLLELLLTGPKRGIVRAQNDLDFRAADIMTRAIKNLATSIPRTDDHLLDAVVRRGLAVGELARHFDSQTVGSVNGWLQHNLRAWGSLRSTWLETGMGLSGPDARAGSGTGELSGLLVGTSQVHLNLNAITRDDLFADGFIAVFEEPTSGGTFDTLRLIVPAEPACRAMVMEACEAIGKCYGEGSHRHRALQAAGAVLHDAFKTDISYVGDRLNALLRMQPTERPTIAVVGAKVTEHALVGDAAEFSDMPAQWHQLFPLGLLQQLREVVASSDGSAPPEPPLIADGIPRT